MPSKTENQLAKAQFTLLEVIQHNDTRKWQCNNCQKVLVAKSTTRLREHLESKNCRPQEQASTSSLQTQSSKRLVQPAITNSFNSMSEEEAEIINDKLLNWIYCTDQPFNLLEDKHFKEFIFALRPSFKRFLPTRKEASNTLLDKKYQEVKRKVEKTIEETENLTLSTDFWLDDRKHHVLHFTIPLPSRAIFLKSVDFEDRRHTAENIAQEIQDILEYYGPSKFTSIVTDNESAMIAAGNLVKRSYPHIISLGCLAHVLNLLIGDIVAKIDWIGTLMSRAHNLVMYIRNNSKIQSVFDAFPGSKKLVDYCPTRWHSSFKMIDSILNSKAVILSISDSLPLDIQDNIFSSTYSSDHFGFWKALEELRALLLPIKNAILTMESDSCTLIRARQVISDLWEELKKINSISVSMSRIWNGRLNMLMPPESNLCHLLIPTKLPEVAFDNFAARDLMRKYFLDESQEDYGHIFADFMAFKCHTGKFKDPRFWVDIASMDTETWWISFGNNAPKLRDLALKLYNCSTSSASVERSFSRMSLIRTQERNRLKQEKAVKLLFIRHNLD